MCRIGMFFCSSQASFPKRRVVMISRTKTVSVFAEEHHIDPATVGKVLVVGGRSTNFPGRFYQNPRFVFWGSTQPCVLRRRKIPAGVTHVIITRFVSHKLILHLRKIMPPGVRFVNRVDGTCAISQFLEAVESTPFSRS